MQLKTVLVASLLGFLGLNSGSAVAGDSAAGEALAGTVCIACHGPAGEGVGPFPAVNHLSADDFAAAMQAYRAGERSDEQMEALSRNLTDQQIKDLAAFFTGN